MTREPTAIENALEILNREKGELRAEVERLKAAIAWTLEVHPGKTREGCAVVEMTWDQFNTMRALASMLTRPRAHGNSVAQLGSGEFDRLARQSNRVRIVPTPGELDARGACRQGGIMSTYRDAKKTVRSVGMDVEDGLALTFACADYPDWVRAMNGWAVEDAARCIQKRKRGAAALTGEDGTS